MLSGGQEVTRVYTRMNLSLGLQRKRTRSRFNRFNKVLARLRSFLNKCIIPHKKEGTTCNSGLD